MFDFKKKDDGETCRVKFCMNTRKRTTGGLCEKHSKQLWRAENPKKYAYNNLRDSARQRKIQFSISYDYFCGLADAFGYFIVESDNHGDKPSIDRRDATKGYVEGNLRVITVSENVIKGNKERHLPEHVQEILRRQTLEKPEHNIDPDNCPF